MKKVFYIVTYARFENGILLNDGSLATARKADYIAESIFDSGYEVEIVSTIRPQKKFIGISPKKTFQLSEGIMLVESPYLGDAQDFFFRRLRNAFSKLWLTLYMIRNIGKDDIVVFYHNCIYARQLLIAHKLKHFKVVLEIEDIFHKVWNMSKKETDNEKLILSNFTDNCITAADTIIKELGLSNSIVSYGSYKIFRDTIPPKANEDVITLICTGSIDKERGIGFMALEIISKLSNRYRLMISGTITEDCKDEFLELIDKVNKEAGFDKCQYLGVLNEDDYEKLLLSADIALNPQRHGDFDKYVFPSKILTYLGYNLDVVTTPGESIVLSDLKNILHISRDYEVQSIVDSIINVDTRINRRDYRDDITRLDNEFKEQMRCLLDRQ